MNSNSDAVASDKLLKIVKLGLAVSKCTLNRVMYDILDLEDSNLSRDFPHIAHAFQPNLHNGGKRFFFISYTVLVISIQSICLLMLRYFHIP